MRGRPRFSYCIPPVGEEPGDADVEGADAFPCELDKPEPDSLPEPALPGATVLSPWDFVPPPREPLDDPKCAPGVECPPDRAPRGELAGAEPGSALGTELSVVGPGCAALPGIPADPPSLSLQTTPDCLLIPKLPLPATQLPPPEPPGPPPDAVVVLPADPKLAFPVVQLDSPPLPPAGLVVLLLAPAGLAVGEAAAACELDGVVPAPSRVPVCCVCAVPRQGNAAAAKIAIRNALPFLASLMA